MVGEGHIQLGQKRKKKDERQEFRGPRLGSSRVPLDGYRPSVCP